MNQSSDTLATIHRPQGRLNRGDIDFMPPSHARLVAVAVGLEEWTPREMAWLVSHPKWLQFEKDFREVLGRECRSSEA
jgi:hypothetical protein